MTSTANLALLLFMPGCITVLALVLLPTVARTARARILPLMAGLILLSLAPALLYWRFGIEIPSWVYLLGIGASSAALWRLRRQHRPSDVHKRPEGNHPPGAPGDSRDAHPATPGPH